MMTPRETLLAYLKSSPSTERAFLWGGWDRTGAPELWSLLYTMQDWIAIIEGAPVRPTKQVRVVSTVGLRRREKPVNGKVIDVLANGTTETVYEDASDDPVYVKGWLNLVRGGWISAEYVTAA